MPAPKGTRVVNLQVNATDAVHVYSDAKGIWLQLRRRVPTKDDLSASSFKVALSLDPTQAIAIAEELRSAAERQRAAVLVKKQGSSIKESSEPKKKKSASGTKPSTASARRAPAPIISPVSVEKNTDQGIICPKCSKAVAIEHNGGVWCVECGGFVVRPTVRPSPSRSQKPIDRTLVVDLISETPQKGSKVNKS